MKEYFEGSIRISIAGVRISSLIPGKDQDTQEQTNDTQYDHAEQHRERNLFDIPVNLIAGFVEEMHIAEISGKKRVLLC